MQTAHKGLAQRLDGHAELDVPQGDLERERGHLLGGFTRALGYLNVGVHARGIELSKEAAACCVNHCGRFRAHLARRLNSGEIGTCLLDDVLQFLVAADVSRCEREIEQHLLLHPFDGQARELGLGELHPAHRRPRERCVERVVAPLGGRVDPGGESRGCDRGALRLCAMVGGDHLEGALHEVGVPGGSLLDEVGSTAGRLFHPVGRRGELLVARTGHRLARRTGLFCAGHLGARFAHLGLLLLLVENGIALGRSVEALLDASARILLGAEAAGLDLGGALVLSRRTSLNRLHVCCTQPGAPLLSLAELCRRLWHTRRGEVGALLGGKLLGCRAVGEEMRIDRDFYLERGLHHHLGRRRA
mmetsp:Transcript_10062/g.29297  ORF Transcript_10062/g.29297 Transcript_10062/m.29297 type:complete len:360 (+) Transcript_10062:1444-2523(+)|eukprot:scaffold34615_cov26-Tisochrysis_lutea.AAC.3